MLIFEFLCCCFFVVTCSFKVYSFLIRCRAPQNIHGLFLTFFETRSLLTRLCGICTWEFYWQDLAFKSTHVSLSRPCRHISGRFSRELVSLVPSKREKMRRKEEPKYILRAMILAPEEENCSSRFST